MTCISFNKSMYVLKITQKDVFIIKKRLCQDNDYTCHCFKVSGFTLKGKSSDISSLESLFMGLNSLNKELLHLRASSFW